MRGSPLRNVSGQNLRGVRGILTARRREPQRKEWSDEHE